jgi:hypothetical protein
MENHVRIFRENPIAWWDKPVMRFLRKKYGHNKRLFVSLRGVYLALCEIESDFVDQPINFFTQTVGTYAGITREVAGRCINLLEKEGLISKTRIKDEKSRKFLTGTIIILRSLKSRPAISEPLPRIASIGDHQQRGSWASIRKITNDKKLSIYKNVSQKTKESRDRGEYYAQLLADKLGDQKSINFYRAICIRYDPHELLRKAHEIITDGKARNPAAIFVHWLRQQQGKQPQLLY